MSEKETATTAEVKKVNRRGIGSARGTERLKFSHEHANAKTGLFIGHLESVEVKTITIGEDTTGLPSFNGMEIPKVVLTFASNEEEANKRRYQTLQFTAVESNTNTIPGGKEEWKINAIFDWFKHILDVYVLRGRELTDEESAALCLPFEDFEEENGSIVYNPIDVETVIAGWKTLFENFANIMNSGKNGEPYYKSNGKNIAIWFKLLRYVKNGKKNEWKAVANGNLAFPTFVGEGCIEIFKQGVNPSIRVDLIKECITPKDLGQKAKAPNLGGMGAPMMGGVPVMDSPLPSPYEQDLTAIAEDMPF